MVLSGSKNTNFANGFLRLAMEWTATQNVAGNYSAVKVNLYLQGLKSTSTIRASALNNGYIIIDGTRKNFTSTSAITGTQKKLLSSYTVNVKHNADGSKKFSISTGFDLNVTFAGTYYGGQYANGDYTMNTIPRASAPTLSANSMNVGAAITVYTNRASTSFTHTLEYEFGKDKGTIETKVGVSAVFTVPKKVANEVINSISGTGKVICKTYNGSTLIGSKSVNFTAWIPEVAEFIPTIETFTVSDAVTAIKTKFNAYVQQRSKLTIKFSAAGAYSSTIKSHKITANGSTYTSTSAETEVLLTSGNNTVTVTATDSRGRKVSKSQTINVLPYSEPLATSLIANRVNADGTANDEGSHVKVAVIGSIGSVNNLNDKVFKIAYKKTFETDYKEVTLSSSNYTINTSIILSNMDENSTYDIVFFVLDYFTNASKTLKLSTAFTLVDYFAGGKGIAFGKVAEKEGMEVDLTVDFNKEVTTNKAVNMKEAPSIISPTSTAADGAFTRLKRSDGTLLAFIATGEKGTGLNIHMYDGKAWSGMVTIGQNGDIYTTGKITAAGGVS